MIIDGKAIAEQIERVIRAEITKRNLRLSLASLFVGNAADSALYTRRKAEAAARLGVMFTIEQLPETASVAEVKQAIAQLNARTALDGYIMQLPLPPALRSETDELLNLIDPTKDVDGLTRYWHQKLLGEAPEAFWPTPIYAVLVVLASVFGDDWLASLQWSEVALPQLVPAQLANQQALIISDGDVFGPTLAWALERGGMSALTLRSDDKDLHDALLASSLIVTAVGKPEFLTGDRVPEGAIVIDVGTTLVGHRTIGDVHFASVAPKARAITPVPGGVGPVTVAMLYANLLYLKMLQNKN